MVFSFKNLGIIESAEIDIKGLTVITGLNDTGKSFLSKAIYSIIKTIREAKDNGNYDKADQFEMKLRPLNSVLRQSPGSNFERFYSSFRSEIVNGIIRKIADDILLAVLEEWKAEFLKIIKENNIIIENVDHLFKELAGIISSKSDVEEMYMSYFDKMIIQQLFRGQINNFETEKSLRINCDDLDGNVLEVNIVENKTATLKLNNAFFYQDATLIDSPIILQLAFFIRQSRVRPQIRRNDDRLPNYYLDLVYKLPGYNLDAPYPFIYSDIEKLIGGKFIYKEKSDNFVYLKNSGHEVEATNTANGIKSFGLLQLLLTSGVVNQSSLLIIDEPEVHLHPKWEVEYAKIIIALVKTGIPILLSSHSPYLLRALKKYSKGDAFVKNVTKFYYGEIKEGEKYSNFIDVTEDTEPIFNALALPMQSLV